MKIELNLLPDKNKKSLKTRRYFWIIFEQELHVIIAIFILIVGLAGINFIISYNANALEDIVNAQKEESNSKEIEKIRNIFNEINSEIRNIDNLIENSISWNYLLNALSYTVNDKIAIESLKVENTSLIIKAIAETRMDAIEFKEKISEIKRNNKVCFGEPNIPSEDLVSSKFVEFNLIASITKDCIVVNKNLVDSQ